MPTVYVRGSERVKRRFHRTEDCKQLRKKPARGEPLELQEVDLDDLRFKTPCRDCYPDTPRARSVHLRCSICHPRKDYIYPCPHNGGVPVYRDKTYSTDTLFHDAGEVVSARVYVWPEDVRHFIAS